MLNVANTIALLGKSENDNEVTAFLHDASIPQPLKRPARDEFQVNIQLEDQPIELCFVTAESLGAKGNTLAEGELILNTVFIIPDIESSDDDPVGILPFGLNIRESRSATRKNLGDPEWSSPVMKNDRWIIDGIRVLICFSNDESSVRQIAFSYDP